MRSITRLALTGASVLVLLLLAVAAAADPGEDHGHDGIEVPPPTLPNFGPGIENMQLLDAADKDGTINSDIAFYKRLAFVGNYDGFRIFDVRKPWRMRLLSDTRCRANQGDLSVFKSRDGRLILLQSIDRPVTAPDCSAVDTATIDEDELGVQRTRARFGYEGLRMFDVTNPASPRFIGFYRTQCGSHTHTLVPDRKRGAVHAYVASYPLGSHITPQVDRAESDALGLTCEAPHRKISIVSIPLADPESGQVRTKALSEDTEPYDPDGPFDPTGGEGGGPTGGQPAFQACHDHQAFLPRNIMVASCAGDAQYWDISRRGNPSSADGEPHTHIQREVREDDPTTPENERVESFDFMHNATVTWDGKVAAIVDESGGGVEPRCDGANTKRGWTFFYPLVRPGRTVDGFDDLLGRYIVPRPQNGEVCVSHNGNVLPTTNGRYWQVQAFYQAGNSFFDFTDPSAPTEIGWSDLESSLGLADSWSSYWYNDVMFVNGGLNRRGDTGNRGFEAYALYDEDGDRVKTRNWRWLNPQTQEEWQVPKGRHR
jgi:hypothetical protein